jgi:lectin-like protein
MNARRAAWVLPWAALGCLPQTDDLSAYSAEWSPSSSEGGAVGSFGGRGGSLDATGGTATGPAPTSNEGGSDGVVGGTTLPLAGGGGGASVGIDDANAVGADAGVPGGEGGASGQPLQQCADGVIGPDGSECYRVVLTGAFWQDARDQCAAWGGALVKVETPAEDAFLDGLVPVSFWLGGSDTAFENLFVWTDGSPMAYGNWGPNQPDRFPGPDCVEKRDPLTNRLWYDQPCNNALAFVCEKPLGAP